MVPTAGRAAEAAGPAAVPAPVWGGGGGGAGFSSTVVLTGRPADTVISRSNVIVVGALEAQAVGPGSEVAQDDRAFGVGLALPLHRSGRLDRDVRQGSP